MTKVSISANNGFKPLSAQRGFGFKPVASTSKLPANADIIAISSDDDEVVQIPEKVLKSAKAQGKAKDTSDAQEQLWIDQFPPLDTSELAVHKKKVEDVKNWLREALDNQLLARYRFQRILVLSGPSGSGKTATVKCLAREINFELLEYKSGDEIGATSLTMHFSSFLARASAAPTLKFQGEEASTQKLKGKKAALRKVILVEDLPNIFTSDVTKSAFRNALTAFVKVSRDVASHIPMILIISESLAKQGGDNEWANNSVNWSDSVSTRTIVPPELLKGGKCTEIKFNAIAETILKKGLQLIVDKVTAISKNTLTPSPQALTIINRNSNGDIRSAINTLQFIVREGKNSTLKVMTAPRGKKRKSGGAFKEDDDINISTLINGRETSLFIFHALGKVLFSKRWGEKPEEDEKELKKGKREPPPKTSNLPTHLKHYKRKPSKVDTNELFASAPVDSDLFLAYMHQNYTPFMEDLDHCENGIDYLSQADALMRMEGDTLIRHPLTSQYSFQTSVRGLMMSLPVPVPRKGQKFFKAELWDRNRKMRENAISVNSLLTDLTRTYGKASGASGTATRPSDPIIQHLNSRRVLIADYLAYPSLLQKQSQLAALPTHVSAILKELSAYKLPESQRQQLMDENDVDSDVAREEENVVQTEAKGAQEELLYLPDDDIMEFD